MRHLVFRGLALQLAVCACLACILWVLLDNRSVLSFLAGAGIFFFANTYLVFQTFRQLKAPVESLVKSDSQSDSSMVLLMLVKGEFGKIILCLLGFALVFKYYENPNYMILFFGFIVMIFLHILFAGRIAQKLS